MNTPRNKRRTRSAGDQALTDLVATLRGRVPFADLVAEAIDALIKQRIAEAIPPERVRELETTKKPHDRVAGRGISVSRLAPFYILLQFPDGSSWVLTYQEVGQLMSDANTAVTGQ